MARLPTKSSPLLPVAIALLVGCVSIADFLTPLGIAVWVFYLAPVALCLFGRTPRLPLVVATATTMLTVVSLVMDPRGISEAVAQVNRTIGIVTVWAVALMVRQLVVSKIALEREEWLRAGHTRVLEAVQGDLSAAELGARAMRMLAEYTGAQVGAFYVVDGSEFRRIAGYALDEVPHAVASFQRGQGVVGQAGTDGRVVIVNDVSEEHLEVRSGLVRAQPRSVIVAPFRVDGVVVGVMELASVDRIDDVHRQLLERVSDPLAVAVRSAQYRSRLQELLEETQRQSDALQAQQEELRVANEELEEQSHALRESQARLELQQADLEQSNAQLEMQTQELERQKDEAQRSRGEAERATRYKTEFLANMSHELRTPLNSSLILAKLLAENKDGNLTPDQIRFAETIHAAGNDLLALINDILDLSKIEAGKVEVVAEESTPQRLVSAMEQTFAPIATQKGLAFRTEVAPQTPQTVFTDIARVQQILKNLLSNAFKFTEKGEVALRISPAAGDLLRFEVQDSGIGIPESQHEVIFGAFRQADGSTSRAFGGTGLGLSISRDLARLLGGDIEVKSAPDEGSTFTLVLPRNWDPDRVQQVVRQDVRRPRRKIGARSSAVASAPTVDVSSTAPEQTVSDRPAFVADDRDSRPRRDRTILVIEDDPAFGQILYDLIHELEFDCLVAPSAEEGIALARQLSPSGILLDMALPDGSGLSVLERLKRNPDTRHIPVHVVSVSDYTQAALQLGAIGYAFKPIKREELISAVRKLESKLKQDVRRVLVVEDDPEQRDGTQALLASDGVEITAVGTAGEALEAVSRQSFDCMVLDLNLPDSTGYDVLEKMAAGDQYSFPPAIVYTGSELSHEEEQRLRRYSRSIIIKGVRSPERLLDEVTLFLHQVESRLPPERQRMLREARQRDAAFEGRRILVVEDDVRNIFALSSVLEPRGAKVEIARNGKEALQALERSNGIDLVLMDIMMPVMDGLTAMREIRKNAKHKALPIVALTAKAMRDDHENCLKAGANDYMSKPIDPDKLLSLCRVWMPR